MILQGRERLNFRGTNFDFSKTEYLNLSSPKSVQIFRPDFPCSNMYNKSKILADKFLETKVVCIQENVSFFDIFFDTQTVHHVSTFNDLQSFFPSNQL